MNINFRLGDQIIFEAINITNDDTVVLNLLIKSFTAILENLHSAAIIQEITENDEH
jgi:hypothetical protein